jgi:acyl-coenzyme A thioesterase PaaI-like protein
MELTPYSVLLARIAARDGEASVEVPEDWTQGRTTFGGLQAAIALAAMRSVAPAAPLRSLQATFLAPVPGGTVRARARVLRSGKSATHVEGRLVDGDETLALLVGVFGQARESAVTLRPVQPAIANVVAAAPTRVAGSAPSFARHFDGRWIVGSPPFTGSSSPENVIELSMHDTGPATEAHVLAMADYVPPIALSYLRERVPGASLSWMLELLSDDVSALPLSGWRIDARMAAAGEGYVHQSLVLWGPGGVPVALGRQSMVIFG